MTTLLKFLSLVLISFLVYDTINFILHPPEEPSPKRQLEVRPKYEAAKTCDIPPVQIQDNDILLGLGCFMFLVCFAAISMIYFANVRKRQMTPVENNTSLELQPFPDKSAFTYYCNEYNGCSPDDPRLMKNISEMQLTLVQKPPSRDSSLLLRRVPSMAEFAEPTVNQRFQYEEPTRKTHQMTSEDEGNNDGDEQDMNELSIIDINLLSYNTSLSVQNSAKRDNLLTRTDTSFPCDCNLDHFEERLSAIEHGLKTSSEATKEWSKRIEQAEVDLVNLHRQMYTILSKAEFVAPSSDVFSKTAGDVTPTDFYDPTLYKVPDIIVETKKELERGDLFKNSLAKLSTDDNWSTLMEEELTEKIKQMSNSQHVPKDQSSPPVTIDACKIKESLMKKNEELKEKTKHMIRSMEEVVNANTLRKNKLGVHSHFVAPYKKIQVADADYSSSVPPRTKPKSKVKI